MKISTSNRDGLSQIFRLAKGGIVDVQSTADYLELSNLAVSKMLSSFAQRGWLRRIRRGIYHVVPLGTIDSTDIVMEDPWAVASRAFSPCYIGGWSAAEHWGLTEQIFRTILVVTGVNVRSTNLQLLSRTFRLVRIPRFSHAGIVRVQQRGFEVDLSSRERTVLDGLRKPGMCAGFRHLTVMLSNLVSDPTFDPNVLIKIARRACNGAAWKRLGFIFENNWPGQREVVVEALSHRTKGYVKLDPSIAAHGKLNTHWGLWINSSYMAESS